LGMMISTCPSLNLAYIVPAKWIVEDLETPFAAEFYYHRDYSLAGEKQSQIPAELTKAAADKKSEIDDDARGIADLSFKLKRVLDGGLRDKRSPEYSIFVGDLGTDVNEFDLISLFRARFPSYKNAEIMTKPITGMSGASAFVRFSDESDQQRAILEMDGVYCGNRPMRILPVPKTKSGSDVTNTGGIMSGGIGGSKLGTGAPPLLGYYGAPQPMNQFTDPNNTTVFVGGLSGYVTEDELRSFFEGFGEINYVRIPPGKGCGFIQFARRRAAVVAINQMQGRPIGNYRVRLSWGRSESNSGPSGTSYRPASASSEQSWEDSVQR